MFRRFFLVLLALAPLFAFAAEAAEHHSSGIPWKTIGVQSFNLLLLCGVIFYFTKEGVIDHFKDRKKSYLELVGKADAAKKEAQAKYLEVSQRLAALQDSAKGNAQKAHMEANLLKDKLINESNEISAKLRAEAGKTAEIEIAKAKLELQGFALQQAIDQAKSKLHKDASQTDQQRLQSEFIDKIQAVPQ